MRQIRKSGYDHFVIEPSASVADPLSDIFAQMSGGMSSFSPRPSPLTAPISIPLQLNEWLCIRKAGHYRITADTTRVASVAQPGQTVPLRSNTIEIDVVAPEDGWTDAQLQQAVTVLQIPDPPAPVVGQVENLSDRVSRDADVPRAAQTLRFLETKEAARALARFFEQGPRAAQGELRAGLFASPYRKEVIAAMEEKVALAGRSGYVLLPGHADRACGACTLRWVASVHRRGSGRNTPLGEMRWSVPTARKQCRWSANTSQNWPTRSAGNKAKRSP